MQDAKIKRVIVGFYNVPEFGSDNVETEVKGTPREQYARLDAAIQKRHPKHKGKMKRLGSTIEVRSGSDDYVDLTAGMTIGQIFQDEEGIDDPVRTVGRVFVSGAPYDVLLVYTKAAGTVRVRLNPVLKNMGSGVVRFSNQINGQLLAKELPQLIADVIGAEARRLVLRFRDTVKP
jgi:hypothetical protein